MNRLDALRRFADARVARLATVRPDGSPHLVPVTFALQAEVVFTMIDHKSKSTTRLQRLVNIEANPNVTMLVDRFSENWADLWWVRVDGTARIHDVGDVWRSARSALVAKYPQYVSHEPRGPALAVGIEDVRWWESTP